MSDLIENLTHGYDGDGDGDDHAHEHVDGHAHDALVKPLNQNFAVYSVGNLRVEVLFASVQTTDAVQQIVVTMHRLLK